ncbi:MAG: hypothetical protein N2170_09915, partial [Bacteroidia bacterium]|nr:hypothetical protein [Bacteroidia bacterium]
MQTWIINKQLPNWIWPGSAYIRGRSQSLLRRSGTGGGLGSPLYDTLRLAAGDTLYFLFTHEHGGGIG